MARATVREISAPSALQGIAAPVNTYVRPTDPAPSSLHQLAEGLAGLDDGLGSFMAKRKGKADEADKQKAIRDAYLGASEGFDHATKSGAIPPQESPTYMKWFKATQGDVRGRQLIDQFDVAYNQWEGRNSGDPEAFKQFVGGFLKEHVGEETDPEVLAGLNPHIEQIFSGGYANFTKDRANAIYGGALAAHGASLTDHIEKAEGDARATGKVIDYETLWGTLLSERNEALKRNLEKDVDGFLVDSIILQAEEADNEDLLTLLDRKLPGKEYAISSDVEVRKKIDSARDHIASKLASKATTLAAQEEKEDKARHNALVAGELTKINQDPKYQIPEDTLKEISKRDPEFRTKLPGYRRSIITSAQTPEDPEALLEAYAKIDGGAGTAYVLSLKEKGVVTAPETLTKMLDRVHSVEKASQSDGILQSPAYKDTVKLITNATGQGQMDYLDSVRGLTDDGARALFDYRSQILKWSQENPNGGVLDREKAAMEIGKTIRDRIIPTPDSKQQGTYPQPDEQPKPQAAALAETPAMAPASPANEQQGAVQPPTAEEPKAPIMAPGPRTDAANELARRYKISPEAAHELLLEEERSGVAPGVDPASDEAFRQRSGLPAQDASPEGQGGGLLGWIGGVADRVYQGHYLPDLSRFLPDFRKSKAHEEADRRAALEAADSAQSLGPDARGSLPEDTRIRLTSLLRNPPMLEDGNSSAGNTPVAPLLNLLGHTEGTDKGAGYSETLGYGKFSGGAKDLTKMTLDQIDQMQTAMLSHPENKWNASPAGRYQIVRQTLRTLRRDLGLSGYELFDKNMQDRLGMALLERRGLKQWQSGQITDEQFMRSLNSEWTSLPKHEGALKQTLGEVKKGGPIQVASTDPEAGFREWLQQEEGKAGAGGGSSDLVTSTKRGYQPDMDHLKPGFKAAVGSLQSAFGKTLPIVSGFRDTQRNAKAGGAKGSQHIHGNAVDIDASGWSREERIRFIQMARDHGFGGIGVYPNSIHIDMGRERAWGPSHHGNSLPKWARDALLPRSRRNIA